jgi:hypothetical protein
MVDIFGDDDARETCWDIASSDTTGPELTLAGPDYAAVQPHRTGHSCAAQHFVSPNDGVRTFAACTAWSSGAHFL